MIVLSELIGACVLIILVWLGGLAALEWSQKRADKPEKPEAKK